MDGTATGSGSLPQVDGRQKAWMRVVSKRKPADGLQESHMIVSSFMLLTQQAVGLPGDSKLLQDPTNQRCEHAACILVWRRHAVCRMDARALSAFEEPY